MASIDRRVLPRLLRPFAGEAVSPPPIWLMRQAGRYLPEYRALRAKAGSFLELCYTPALAAEAALQPIRRYGFDAAILFSDILVVPDALGQAVAFTEGEGPRLQPIRSAFELTCLRPAATEAKFARVCEAVARVRQGLPEATALIGFCGAPWTVASYMVEGRGSPDQAQARLWAYRDPQGFERLISLLEDVSVEYLSGQIDAGADVVQIFDSWAGSLPDDQFRHWVIEPTRRLLGRLKERHPAVPVIGFPRGAGPLVRDYAGEAGVDGVSCDWTMPLRFMTQELRHTVVQGNLDPLLLLAGGPAMESRVAELVWHFSQRAFIFNLGHGIQPQTPPQNVARLVDLVRGAD